ncbi:MAG: phosphatidylglycerol lysyltransferase domain-containing protein [Thermodesulfobacteriota bacterium]
MTLAGYKDLELNDHQAVGAFLQADPPRTSELTFTNLFMWRHHYRPQWRAEAGCLLMVLAPQGQAPFGLPPIGPGDKISAARALCADLQRGGVRPSLQRVGAELAADLAAAGFKAQEDRDQSDYVYLAADLATLPGRRYHRKKNHYNKFAKNYRFEYRPLEPGLVGRVLEMQESWCALRECHLDQSLASEDRAVYEALSHFGELDYSGGVILIADKVEAFSLGEPLNPDTAVIHIEKGNPAFDGIYAAINLLFVAEAWSEMTYINREQDLGVEGLRQAKESYLPARMVAKYVVTPEFI